MRYLLVLIDRFTSFVEIVPVPDVSAGTTALAILTEWVVRYGTMEQIVSDNGTAFINATVAELTRILEIDMVRITARRPQANGKAERAIQTIKTKVRAVCADRRIGWPLAAKLVGLSIRTTESESTGFTPAKLFFGRELDIPLDLQYNPPPREYYDPESYAHTLHKALVETSATARALRGKAQRRQKRYYDRAVFKPNFEVGELVWVRNPDHRGLDPAVWLGPYRVVQQISERNYRLLPEFIRENPFIRTPNPSHNIYNVDRIKKCIRKPNYQDTIDRFGLKITARLPESRVGNCDEDSPASDSSSDSDMEERGLPYFPVAGLGSNQVQSSENQVQSSENQVQSSENQVQSSENQVQSSEKRLQPGETSVCTGGTQGQPVEDLGQPVLDLLQPRTESGDFVQEPDFLSE
uniref:Integrase catalytic domain-containing protein n=2 Tax=Macrostomum lignano TaxID=282301 RepID=A0A1I8I0V4_9PLAT